MQFQIICKHCHRSFVITSEGGKTLKCNCPYCGENMVVATPNTEQFVQGASNAQVVQDSSSVFMDNVANKAIVQTKNCKSISGVGKTTIVVFTILFVGILILSSLLYIIFSAMSN